MIRIRTANPQDCERMVEIYAPNVIDSTISFEQHVPSAEEFNQRLATVAEKFPWLVYEENGVVFGYAYAGQFRSRWAYQWSAESTVYVAAERHGRGVGTSLYRTLFSLLEKQGIANVFAGVTLPNAPSVRLHESLGFQPVGTFRDVGFKLGEWRDVGWYQLRLERPPHPRPLQSPVVGFELSL